MKCRIIRKKLPFINTKADDKHMVVLNWMHEFYIKLDLGIFKLDTRPTRLEAIVYIHAPVFEANRLGIKNRTASNNIRWEAQSIIWKKGVLEMIDSLIKDVKSTWLTVNITEDVRTISYIS
ncbi:hypothetical protein RF11_13094 [Thelohanellus kitauei]|uniref:Uncharacterized protein n=1 Tax=Thelohanellus kitauei TaxID=669202 RepID=A0A0C2M033_THEKT|nr:hypothetical protein RF11_13094 [Thelohanellus kitauei]